MSRSATAFPLSFGQQRLWFLDQMAPENPFYNLPAAIPLRTRLNVRALGAAVNEVVRRHEALRTTFGLVDGEPSQVVSPQLRVPLPIEDLTHLGPDARQAEARRLAAVEAATPFDLLDGPLLRIRLLVLGPTEHVLLLTVHHIVADGWSMGVLWRELTTLYAAATSGRPPPLPELAIQYGDFAVWQREQLSGDRLQRELDHWRPRLQDLPVLELPTDHPRPPVLTYAGGVERLTLAPELTRSLRELCREEGATLFMTLLAGFLAMLDRYTGQQDLAIGTPVAGRDRPELEELIGFFVNMLVLRGDTSDMSTFRMLVRRTRDVVLDALTHQRMPFEKLVEALRIERDLSRNPLFQVTFQLFLPADAAPSVSSSGSTSQRSTGPSLLEIERGAAVFDLGVSMWDTGDRIHGMFEYNTDLFERATVQRLAQHFATLLAVMADHPDRAVHGIPLLDDDERAAVVRRSMGSVVPPVTDRRLHGLVEQQVTRTPHRIAVSFRDQQLSYRELDGFANRFAAVLCDRGVGAGHVVGLLLDRSLELVVAMLGVLKAGAAYLPMDPELPTPRLDAIADDARPSLIVTGGDPVAALRTEADQLQLDLAELEGGVDPVAADRAGGDLAYVMYTSGSTGAPRGVAVGHAAVTNHMVWMARHHPLSEDDVLLQKTPFGFDASVWEFFLPLMSGARLVLAEPGGHRDVAYLVSAVAEHDVTVLQLVPSMLELFLDEPGLAVCHQLGEVFAGGESLSPALRDTFLATTEARLHNLYGPTECCIQTVTHSIAPEDGGDAVPIGLPIDNVEAYVLDEYLNLLPDGVPGELHLGGMCLARGYVGQPGETATAFVPNPYGPAGSRLYRTGDRVRRRADGSLLFLGRVDRQVKIRGLRVEPEEVEALLLAHPAVRQAVVVVRDEPLRRQQLVAYATPSGASQPQPDALRRHLATQLPDHLVPATVLVLDALPRLPNGKLDVRSLPSPEWGAELAARVDPRDGLEAVLHDIWVDTLDTASIGVHDNFFTELGGHSLLATQLCSRVRETLQISLPLQVVFECPTVAALAERLRSDPATSSRIERTAELVRMLHDLPESELAQMLAPPDAEADVS